MKNITYKIIKIVIVMGILSSVFSCKEKKDVYIWDRSIRKKEKIFKLSLDGAEQTYIQYILKKEIASDGFYCLDVIYGDYFIFSQKVKTDGVFKKIEKLYKITVIPENSEPHTNTEIVETRVTDLGKKIDVIKIIKDYDPENISI